MASIAALVATSFPFPSVAACHSPLVIAFVIAASSFVAIIVANMPFVTTVPLRLEPMLELAFAFAVVTLLLVVMLELQQPMLPLIVVVASSFVIASFDFKLQVNQPLDQVKLVQLTEL